RLLAHGDARIRREARPRLANGGIGKIDRHPAPVAAGMVRRDVPPATADFEEWSNEAVLLDEPIEAVQHVILERDEIRHARGASRRDGRRRGLRTAIQTLMPLGSALCVD